MGAKKSKNVNKVKRKKDPRFVSKYGILKFRTRNVEWTETTARVRKCPDMETVMRSVMGSVLRSWSRPISKFHTMNDRLTTPIVHQHKQIKINLLRYQLLPPSSPFSLATLPLKFSLEGFAGTLKEVPRTLPRGRIWANLINVGSPITIFSLFTDP